MRYMEFLNESYTSISDRNELNSLIQKNCRYYLKLINNKNPLYRGMSIDLELGIKDVRQDRESLGMMQHVADNFNKWLVKQGHLDRSKSVMATSNGYHTTGFGNQFFIFPIGKFDYTWIKSGDVNLTNSETKWDYNVLNYKFNDKWTVPLTQSVADIKMEDYFVTNKGFNIAYKKEYEIWMNPKQYYFASTEHFNWDTKNEKLWNKI